MLYFSVVSKRQLANCRWNARNRQANLNNQIGINTFLLRHRAMDCDSIVSGFFGALSRQYKDGKFTLLSRPFLLVFVSFIVKETTHHKNEI